MDDYPKPEDILPYYERELALLRRSMRTFSERYPNQAAKLGITGEHCDDPHVERLLQSAALSNARAAARIDDDCPEVPNEMLERLHPEVLRPFPACSIAQIQAQPDPPPSVRTIARGTEFASRRGKYRFRSAYDVTLAPYSIGRARYAAVAQAPRSVILSPDTLGILSITFTALAPQQAGCAVIPDRIRIFLDGAPQVVAALSDALLLHAIGAFADRDDRGEWRALEAVPMAAVGFDDEHSLLGPAPKVEFPLRMLLEYFAFPERFSFIDVDFAMLKRVALSGGQRASSVTLHLAIAGVRHDSSIAQRLSTVDAENLKLFCTPIVNLFQRDVEPGEKTEVPGYPEPRYSVVPSGVTEVADTEVWSIDEVHLKKPGASDRELIEPLHAFGHRKYYGGLVWERVRDGRAAHEHPGRETALVLRKLGARAEEVDPNELAISVTCTNRNLPMSMPIGAPGGDLEAIGAELKCPIVLLRQPTASQWPKPEHGHGWKLLAQLTPHVCRLDQLGLAALKALFRQFAAHAGRQAWQIDGMTALRWRGVKLWTMAAGVGSLEPGIVITISLDEQRFETDCMNTLIGIMDRFFAAYVDMNSSTQLIAVSARTGSVIRKCPPRPGRMSLL
ncbi:type VI secretion system baseplate subunit TssF [Trinickia sp.]|uniref:type VI secretion system baseplate subunit TssF n=1 Tax=Trinickia sp. TaxID=2571163 RepID=UPI003F7E5B2D